MPETSENTNPESVAPVPVQVIDRSGNRSPQEQLVIREKAVTLYLNGRELVTLLCAGHSLDELAAGFLFAEGFLRSPEDIAALSVEEDEGKVQINTRGELPEEVQGLWQKRTITSGCGKGSLFYFALDALLSRRIESRVRISPGQVVDRVEDLNRLSETYRRTHGVHNTALAEPEKILLFRDDIGRHNAVDMIVGHLFLRGIPLDNKILITTGRLTSEILIKTSKVGIPVVISRNTATSLAVELARKLGITLIGFARAGKFTVYSGAERITG